MNDQRAYLMAHYAQLWERGIGCIRNGAVEIDPVLAGNQADLRRGLTLVIRPSKPVRDRVMALLEPLKQLEPDQYYYAPTELHVTFLSLFTATVEHERFFACQADYVSAVDSMVTGLAPFSLCFDGLTVSPGAIMVQGFARNEILDAGRDKLREELRVRGLVEGVDARYRLVTAHMTIARFRQPLRDSGVFAEELLRKRNVQFGETLVSELDLVKNDWYMSDGNLEKLRNYKIEA